MGKPVRGNARTPADESIVCEEGTRGTETSKYPEEEKINNDFLSSGERTGKRPNQRERGQTMEHAPWGCGPAQDHLSL